MTASRITCRAAVLQHAGGKWDVVEVELDPPKVHEVRVRVVASGLCHSDDHHVTGDVPVAHLPYCGGHEGSGIVEEVGPGVQGLEPGDHVVTSFIPGCGLCRWCASGMQNLCNNGAKLALGPLMDGTYRMWLDGVGVSQGGLLGTFSEQMVISEYSCVKIAPHLPLDSAALVACGVPTGWGSAVNAAGVEPGHVVIVMGIGGIGINAVQGAHISGAERVIAVDPVPFKREMALKVGATDAYQSLDEAIETARGATNGQGADSIIVTVGVLRGEHLGAALQAIRKAGTLVVTAVAGHQEAGIPVNLNEFAMYQRRIQGVVYGMMAPSKDIPRLLSLYERGRLKLDELITNRYRLDEINAGYEDMHAGLNIRGLVEFP